MSYELLLFLKTAPALPVSQLHATLPDCRFVVLDGDEHHWSQLLVLSKQSHEICVIDRIVRRDKSRQIARLEHELDDCRPRSAARWANSYMHATEHLYGCRHLSFGHTKAFEAVPSSVMWALQTMAGNGIIHADGQGFSNEDGFQITWEWAGGVKGVRQMAVLGPGDHWLSFELDLMDDAQLSAFRAGERPRGVELLALN